MRTGSELGQRPLVASACKTAEALTAVEIWWRRTVGWEEKQTMWAQWKEPVPVFPQALVVPVLEKVNGGK